MGYLNLEKKWLFPLVFTSAVCLFLIVASLNSSSIRSINSVFFFLPSPSPSVQTEYVEKRVLNHPQPSTGDSVPRFGYLISGSKGDLDKLWRTLFALYHPLNHYIVHLDLESPLVERLELAARIEKHPLFTEVGNVYMITKANMVTYRGPTMIANTLHACAILLKRSKDWDWFINLSASDYPLVTQDDLLFTFSKLDRNFSFIEHTSELGWKFDQRAMPLIVDPGLYMTTKSDIFPINPARSLPTAFKLFTGSAWMVLSREFVEYIVWGWDNLPRILLMYYANFVSSPEGYFQTVICNEPEFAKTAVNSDLHYISWDFPPKQHPHTLSINDTDKFIASNTAFARKFKQDDPVLSMIDKNLLNRKKGKLTPGGWCSGKPKCSKVGDPRKLKPGPGSERLRSLIDNLTSNLGEKQCK